MNTDLNSPQRDRFKVYQPAKQGHAILPPVPFGASYQGGPLNQLPGYEHMGVGAFAAVDPSYPCPPGHGVRGLAQRSSLPPGPAARSITRPMCESALPRPPDQSPYDMPSWAPRLGSAAPSLQSTSLEFCSRVGSGVSMCGMGMRTRKRGLSISPMGGDGIDLNSIIRFSPSSLIATLSSSRGSSSSPNSYGHLSVNSVSPISLCPTPTNAIRLSHLRNAFATPTPRTEEGSKTAATSRIETGSVVVKAECDTTTAAIEHDYSEWVATVKAENSACEDDLSSASARNTDAESNSDDDTEERRCCWRECGAYFETGCALVSHVNNDHIQKNKRDCVCYWEGCSRDRKPFKAMYMLVVHVRRHTGEKPHKCGVPSCGKAYSRLENLKTHIRSHTGERPYVCEFEACTKAFSNASDRAKHQNRTHSSVKQYVCKIPGCPKRYTDPSSLRKHMKTFHGTLAPPDTQNQPCKKVKNTRRSSQTDEPSPSVPESSPASRFSAESATSPGSSVAPTGSSKACVEHKHTVQLTGTRQKPQTESASPCTAPSSRAAIGQPHVHLQKGNLDLYNDAPSSGSMYPRDFYDRYTSQAQGEPNVVSLTGVSHVPPPTVSKHLSSLRSVERRGSEVSVTTQDSSYQSETDIMRTTAGNYRRGSDASSMSLYSSRRSSMVPSPFSSMPDRTLAAQTLWEDQVLLTIDSKPLNAPVPSWPSRLSSGYGSRCNVKIPYPYEPPPSGLGKRVDISKDRRASDGVVFYPGHRPLSGINYNQLRRGSEPVAAVSIIDQVPRRERISAYAPLPGLGEDHGSRRLVPDRVSFVQRLHSINTVSTPNSQLPTYNYGTVCVVGGRVSDPPIVDPIFPPSEDHGFCLPPGPDLLGSLSVTQPEPTLPASSCINGLNSSHRTAQVFTPTVTNLQDEDWISDAIRDMKTELMDPIYTSNMIVGDLQQSLSALAEENLRYDLHSRAEATTWCSSKALQG